MECSAGKRLPRGDAYPWRMAIDAIGRHARSGAAPAARRRRRASACGLAGPADRGRAGDRRLRAPRPEAEGFAVEAAARRRSRASGCALQRGLRRDRARPDAARRAAAWRCSRRCARATPSVPVIVLTARGEIEDRVAGLDAGAVDYLVKPFSLAELRRARARPAARRSRRRRPTTLSAEDIEVDLLTRKVSRGGRAGAALDDRVRAARAT